MWITEKVKKISDKTGYSYDAVNDIMQEILTEIRQNILDGEKTVLPHVGTLRVVRSRANRHNDANQGKVVVTPEKNRVRFITATSLKKDLN